MDVKLIRNFAIISHIDHGKSTLADRLMEVTGLIPPLPSSERKAPRIDRMELEIERGVTIKLKAVRMSLAAQQVAGSEWRIVAGHKLLAISNTPVEHFVLNMIDTPGHVDFSYEVSRSLAACEGALLLVDATQGPQAQTAAHLDKARGLGLAVIGVINKVDSPLARVEETEAEMRALGIEGEILKISALKGEGIDEVFQAVVERISSPEGSGAEPFRALVFDSTYDEHLGAIAYVRVVDGKVEMGDKQQAIGVKFLGTGAEARAKEVGVFVPGRKPMGQISAGEVGYIATGLKDPQAVRVGDTIVLINQSTSQPTSQLPGYKEPQSFVFASFFPRPPTLRSGSRIPDVVSGPAARSAGDFPELKQALNKLRLEEPAVSIEEISSPAFGRGFRLGFLGTFHLEIVKERLEREFDLELTVTKPTVAFKGMEDSSSGRREPWTKVTIITPPDYLSDVIKLVEASRGTIMETVDFGRRLKVVAELPLMEFVRGFYDSLKSLSSGYASLDWEFLGYRPADLVRLDIAVHDEVAEGLSEVVLKSEAAKIGREKVKKLKEIMPRQQFSYALQAKVGGKVLAREDVPALRKDVTAPLYGGDVTRKRKLLKKQRKGKKELARLGRVEIPPKAFLV